MSPRRLVAGVDCSTQATKVVVVDLETGEQIAAGTSRHVVTGTDGARETDPAVWWNALRDALGQTGVAGEIAAIAVGGQQHGLVCLDREGTPLRPAMLWNDTRSAPDAEALTAALEGPEVWAARIGVVPVASFTASKWAWLRRNEPQVADKTAAIRLPHDYLTELLSGAGVTDRGDASGTAWWSSETQSYAGQVLRLPQIGLRPEMLPLVLGPKEAAGTVTASAAETTGLAIGTIVGPGTGDNMAAAVGLGVAPGVPVLSLGTSGTVYLVSETRTADPSGDVAGFADATGKYLPLACTLNCTLAVDRMAEWLRLDRESAGPSRGVVVLPYFDGERTPNVPGASAAIFGLRHDTEPQAILMAAYEGAMVSLLDALKTIDACSSGAIPSAPLVLIGGGARGKVWQETARRLSGRPISIPAATELVAIGAAVQAASVLTDEDTGVIARRWGTDRGTLLEPLPADAETVERHKRVRQLALEAVQK